MKSKRKGEPKAKATEKTDNKPLRERLKKRVMGY